MSASSVPGAGHEPVPARRAFARPEPSDRRMARAFGLGGLRRLGALGRSGLVIVTLVVLSVLLAACGNGGGDADAGEDGRTLVAMVDDEFSPPVVRIQPGGSVRWVHQGRNPHNVTASDGTGASPEVLANGDVYERTFDAPGTYTYFCTFHGTADGKGMAGVVLVGDEARPPEALEPIAVPAEPSGVVIRVPDDAPTIQAAVDAAAPGDLILIAPGVYREEVVVTTPGLTIRGLDRNTTILDGEGTRTHGIHVAEADGVAIENLTARYYAVNGFYWTGVTGYRASYLTAYDNGDYGIYAFDSVDGLIEFSYASGNVDSGIYIGQCYPCNAVVTDSVAEGNGLGYSGTNAGGELYLVRSVWRDNMGGGITPNSLDSELNPPHRETTIVGNLVIDNNNAHAPAKGFGRLAYGNGIILAGGVGDVVERNLVLNHARFGIVVAPLPDRNIWWSHDAVVRDNVVAGSGVADLGLVGPWGPGNCFEGNAARTSLPPLLQVFHRCEGLRLPLYADLAGFSQLLGAQADANGGWPPGSDFLTYPAPSPQPNMPDAATAPGRPAVNVFVRPDLDAIEVPPIPDDITIRAQEVTVSGIPVSEPTFWTLFFGLYAYMLPFALFVTWVVLAVWDLVRRELSKQATLLWLAAILLIPFLGALGYHWFSRSPLPRWLRFAVTIGGLLAYVVVLVIGALTGGLA